jgi:hypothetical protein
VTIDEVGEQQLSPSLNSFPLKYQALDYVKDLQKTAYYKDNNTLKVFYDTKRVDTLIKRKL